MREIVIKGNWRWFWLLIIPLSIGVNVTLFNIHFEFVSMPIPDDEVTKAFNQASSDVVAAKTFSFKQRDKYYLMLETTKEGKDMLEKLEKKK